MQYIRLGKSDLRHQVSMAEISLTWLLTKVTSPVVGATKKDHVDGAVNTGTFN